MAYLTLAEFRNLTLMPTRHVDELESVHAGWIVGQLDAWSAWIDAMLAKRYAVPFASPPPVIVKLWLCHLVTPQCYLRLGTTPEDVAIATIETQAREAREQLAQAAKTPEGLFELPLRGDTATPGISRTTPRGYSEASPYTWSELQRERARNE